MPHLIQKQVPLASHTTLGVGGCAEYFADVRSIEELREVTRWAQEAQHQLTILGGGSNVLIADQGVSGLVIRPLFSDVRFAAEGECVQVTAGAGVVLDALIENLVERSLWGLENLSGIPGTVGGVPIQNVGAYGVEAKDVIVSVDAYDPLKDAVVSYTRDECAFAYRDSYFKHEGKRLIILEVTFRVSKNPLRKLEYKDLQRIFGAAPSPSLQEIRKAVLMIRNGKFPDWRVVGTAGSFFKNPIIPATQYAELRLRYPELPGFDAGKGYTKVSLGWILDHVCGMRGYQEGKIGLYREQALVLVCERGVLASSVIAFAEKIIRDVYAHTGIQIEREVTMIT